MKAFFKKVVKVIGYFVLASVAIMVIGIMSVDSAEENEAAWVKATKAAKEEKAKVVAVRLSDCETDQFKIKIAPAISGKWSEVLAEAKWCASKFTNHTYLKETVKRSTAKVRMQDKADLITKHFSAWHGSHHKFEAYLKERLNESSSYTHLETRQSVKANHMVVAIQYRAKNGFGALRVFTIVAEVSKVTGNVLKIISN